MTITSKLINPVGMARRYAWSALYNKKEKAQHDKMVSLVDSMLSLNKKLAETKTAHGKTVIERQIEATDSQIDRLVYALYGLTEEEITIIQGSLG